MYLNVPNDSEIKDTKFTKKHFKHMYSIYVL